MDEFPLCLSSGFVPRNLIIRGGGGSFPLRLRGTMRSCLQGGSNIIRLISPRHKLVYISSNWCFWAQMPLAPLLKSLIKFMSFLSLEDSYLIDIFGNIDLYHHRFMIYLGLVSHKKNENIRKKDS